MSQIKMTSPERAKYGGIDVHIPPFQGLRFAVGAETQGCALGYRMLAFQAIDHYA